MPPALTPGPDPVFWAWTDKPCTAFIQKDDRQTPCKTAPAKWRVGPICREVLRMKQDFQSVPAPGLSWAQPGNSEAAGTLTPRAATCQRVGEQQQITRHRVEKHIVLWRHKQLPCS